MDGMSMSNMGHKSYTHVTFFWGRNSEILFTGWPGTRTCMYVLALIFIFALGFLIERISHCRLIGDGLKSHSMFAAVLQTLMHATRIGHAYLLMLALMSFTVSVLIVAILGRGVGFFLGLSRRHRLREKYPRICPR